MEFKLINLRLQEMLLNTHIFELRSKSAIPYILFMVVDIVTQSYKFKR